MNRLEQAQLYLKQESCLTMLCNLNCIFYKQCNKYVSGQINLFKLNEYRHQLSKKILRQAKLERI